MSLPFRVVAEVDLDAVVANYRAVCARVGPAVKVLAVVKADAYGHGALAVARRLEAEGAFGFGVGDAGEALELREGGIARPILVLGAIVASEVAPVIEAGISVSLFSKGMARLLHKRARASGKVVPVHLKLDTGMGRLGIRPDRARHLAETASGLSGISVVGAFTHCPASDEDLVQGQWRAFRTALSGIEDLGMPLAHRHMANSAVLVLHPRTHFDMVRPGIFLYGLDPGKLRRAGARLSPALSLRTQIVFVKDVPAGTSIGYRPGYTTYKPTRIATLPVGYADGYQTGLSGKAKVLVRGRPAPVVGRISMDYTTVDVGGVPGAREGDAVTLIGRDGDEEITAGDLAQALNTIPYEVCTMLNSRRVARHFVGSDAP